MKVLFLTASYPTPEDPLLAIFVKEHARAAASAGCDVAVVHLDRSPVRRIELSEIPNEEFPTSRLRYPRSPIPISYAANLLASAVGYRRARRHGEPDLLHAHFFLAGIPAVALGKLLRKPVVLTEHWSVFLPHDPASLSPALRRAARFAFEQADYVLPVSDELRKGIEATGAKARFHVIPNVVDPQRFHPPAPVVPRANGKPAKLLAVGAMYEAKGYEFLLEAIALLGQGRNDFHLDIVGDGPLRPRYEELRRQLGLGRLVSFRGLRRKDEVAELMRAADLFVLTSKYDNNPCAVIEALASGLPVVATAVGGVPELVTEKNGLLASPEDPESIAAQVAAVLDGHVAFDREEIARGARIRFGLQSVGMELRHVYEQAAERKRGGS